MTAEATLRTSYTVLRRTGRSPAFSGASLGILDPTPLERMFQSHDRWADKGVPKFAKHDPYIRACLASGGFSSAITLARRIQRTSLTFSLTYD